MHLQNNVKNSIKGSFWEVLISVKIIINYLKAAHKKYLKIKIYQYLSTYINTAWAKLRNIMLYSIIARYIQL